MCSGLGAEIAHHANGSVYLTRFGVEVPSATVYAVQALPGFDLDYCGDYLNHVLISFGGHLLLAPQDHLANLAAVKSDGNVTVLWPSVQQYHDRVAPMMLGGTFSVPFNKSEIRLPAWKLASECAGYLPPHPPIQLPLGEAQFDCKDQCCQGRWGISTRNKLEMIPAPHDYHVSVLMPGLKLLDGILTHLIDWLLHGIDWLFHSVVDALISVNRTYRLLECLIVLCIGLWYTTIQRTGILVLLYVLITGARRHNTETDI